MAYPISLLLAGLAGTALMTIFLLLPRWMNFAHVDVVRAVGALMLKREHGAFIPGLVVHFSSGIVFAFVYFGLLSLSHLPLNALTGILAGTIHGAIVMLLVCITVMEHHPMTKYHHRGPMTGVMQFLAHILYGVVVGGVFQTLTPAAP